MVSPNRPMSFICLTMSVGYVSECSSSCAAGDDHTIDEFAYRPPDDIGLSFGQSRRLRQTSHCSTCQSVLRALPVDEIDSTPGTFIPPRRVCGRDAVSIQSPPKGICVKVDFAYEPYGGNYVRTGRSCC